jgi:hypothetical protein
MKDIFDTVKRKRRIRSQINCERIAFEDFLSVCPYTVEELRRNNRQPEILVWRYVGMTWLILEGYSLRNSARYFNKKDHATVIHAMKQVELSLSGYGLTRIKSIITLIEGVIPKEIIHIEVPVEDIEQFVKRYHGESPYSQRLIGEIQTILNRNKY